MIKNIQGQEIIVRFNISSLLNGFILVGMMGYTQYKLSELNKKYLILEENLLNHLSTIKSSVDSLQANLIESSVKEKVFTKEIEVPTPIVTDKTIFSFFYDNPYIVQTLIILIGGVVIYFAGASIIANTGQPIKNATDIISNSGTDKCIGVVDKRIGDIGSYLSNINIRSNPEQNLTNIQGFDTNGNSINIMFDSAGKSALAVSVMPKGSDTYIPIESIISRSLESGQVVLQNDNIQELLSHQESEVSITELFSNYHSSPRPNCLIQDSDLFNETSEQVAPVVSNVILENLSKMNDVLSSF